MLQAALTGFGTAFALILAIGAQNAFVLRQGLMRSHVFWVCLICALSDAVLITIGVAGTGSVVAAHPQAIAALTIGGTIFLIIYGAVTLARAMRPEALRAADKGATSLGGALLTCLALTWLNPHVYVDTVGVIGLVSTSFADWWDKLAYGVGATMASFVFFFSLGYGAGYLAPIFARPRAWAILDIMIALVIWIIAANLVLGMKGFLVSNGFE
jgi:L-lysine exporter family protein LysE/ArgO